MLPALRETGVGSLWSDPFDTMESRFNRMFRHLWGDGGAVAEDGVGSYPVDVREDENAIYIEAEMPGFKHDEIEVNLEGGVLTLSGEREAKQCEGTQHLCERRFTRMRRSFRLPSTVEDSSVNAELHDGVLHITLEKREESKPRKIEIK